jgi:DICT domain-containing protein
MSCGRVAFETPFDVVTADPCVRTARKQMLVALSRHLEEQARTAADKPMILSTFQHGAYFGQPTRDRYVTLAEARPLVAVFGREMAAGQTPVLRAVDLDASDPLCDEWVVVTLGPQTAVALIARECAGQAGEADDDRRFDFVVTHDRAVVTAAASALLNRVP